MPHENGRAAAGVADWVLRDQQSVQRFAQRGKHRFLITNAELLRWTQSCTARSRGAAIGGAKGDDAARVSARQQGWDAPCLTESVSKQRNTPAEHDTADHAAAYQQRCFPEFIALRNMVVMPLLARLSTCGVCRGRHDRPSIAMHFVMQTIARRRDR
ncbi:hypothetical protein LGN17_33540 [Burkholderia sp. AU30280]|uniref:hypothetical protein n=1 Tax=Burkholderia sp. AU30280 TaxID=2879628 RepID=UPI001CF52F6F|nr:hypothetical protein [Burkholderia sp. AU30280]MCA8277413.1 hypothetical protein [Burkholderia sp. AU30280]